MRHAWVLLLHRHNFLSVNLQVYRATVMRALDKSYTKKACSNRPQATGGIRCHIWKKLYTSNLLKYVDFFHEFNLKMTGKSILRKNKLFKIYSYSWKQESEFEPETRRSIESSYIHCATEIQVDTKFWRYKLLHIGLKSPSSGVLL